MSEEELEIYNPAASDQHKLGTIFSKKELKKVALINLFFIIFPQENSIYSFIDSQTHQSWLQ